MSGHSIRRATAILVTSTLLAGLTVATVAAPASAAKPKCFGQPATIVGTERADIIVGTNRRDVIVAKGGADKIFGRGGNDLICAGNGNDRVVGNAGIDKLYGGRGIDRMFGGPGPDRLFGGPGPDTIAGQPGDDVIDGGVGVDTCYQGIGTGPVVRCERPVAPDPSPGPSLIPLTGILAVAYSDIDGLDGYSTGDVLIAKLVDTDPGGLPSVGDTIEMGRYPLNLDGSAFGRWIDESHVVDSVVSTDPTAVTVMNATFGEFTWIGEPAIRESYSEVDGSYTKGSTFRDGLDITYEDGVYVNAESPSAPESAVTPWVAVTRPSDDTFVDVVLNY